MYLEGHLHFYPTNMLSSVNNYSLCTIIWNLTPLSLLLFFTALFFSVSLHSVILPLPLAALFFIPFPCCSLYKLFPHPCFIALWAHPNCERGQWSVTTACWRSASVTRDCSDLLAQAHRTSSLPVAPAPNVRIVPVCQFSSIIEPSFYLSHSQSCKRREKNYELNHAVHIISTREVLLWKTKGYHECRLVARDACKFLFLQVQVRSQISCGCHEQTVICCLLSSQHRTLHNSRILKACTVFLSLHLLAITQAYCISIWKKDTKWKLSFSINNCIFPCL